MSMRNVLIVLIVFLSDNLLFASNISYFSRPSGDNMQGFNSHYVVDSTYKQFLNLPYGQAEGNANLLDIYLPLNHSASTRMIVYIHGGSWSRGSKNEFPKILINSLTAKGYGIASINYRLLREGKNQFPSQLDDVRNAIAFLTQQASVYNYNGNEFALLGASAGAHLSLLYAYGHDTKKQIKTVIDIVGPTDLSDKLVRNGTDEANSTISRFLGNPDPKAQIALDASPIYHLTKKSGVPTILFHGESDELVNVAQSKTLYAKLQSLGIQSQLELYPNETHEMRKSLMSVFTKIGVWLDTVYPAIK